MFYKLQASGQGEEDDYELDEEEIIPANDMIGIKQPILQTNKEPERQDKSDNSGDEDDKGDSN